MKQTLIISILLIFISCSKEKSKELIDINNSQKDKSLNVLLFGTFHFANFNPKNNSDVVQVNISDVLSENNQKEIEKITNAIIKFNPDKIFIEYPVSKQRRLDSIYTNFSTSDYSQENRNEKIQIGFRLGKMLKHKKLFAMDYRTSFPYDSLVNQMKNAEQFDLLKKDSLDLARIEKNENKLFSSKKPLTDILYYHNDESYRKSDINWYLSVANQGGNKDNFVGSYLASEWYRRNLYMYSIIQKTVEKNDEKIMILAGASHIGMFKDFIDKNPEWKTTELKEIISK